jgi:Protein of unknown function (DUF1822)
MTYNSPQLENLALPLPITRMARQKAQEFANTQPTPQKAEQVRLNTLAVYVMHDYLEMLGVPTNLAVSDSWNPISRLCADVADLEIIGIGRLECRPLKTNAQTCYIPPEVWSDRLGYLVVQIDESTWEANVLGFSQTAQEELPLHQLQPIEALIDHLNQLLPVVTNTPESNRLKVNLNQWLVNAFESGWQTIESIFNSGEADLAFSFRSGDNELIADNESSDTKISRAKLIDLGVQIASHPVALVVEVTPESEQRKNILLQVHPSGKQVYLPPSLQLIVLDEFGSIFLEAQARNADNYIQLEFRGLAGEQFSVKVALGEASIVEDFII